MKPPSYLVLGMLALGRRTGYEIKQLADKSTRFFWAASYGQIYPELKKLEEAGLVRSEPDPRGGRQRRAHELTDAGERALAEWLRDPDVSFFELRDMALLKLFFADAADPAAAVAIARAASERHAHAQETLEQVERQHPEKAGMTYAVLRFGLDFNRWCTERFAQLADDLQDQER